MSYIHHATSMYRGRYSGTTKGMVNKMHTDEFKAETMWFLCLKT